MIKRLCCVFSALAFISLAASADSKDPASADSFNDISTVTLEPPAGALYDTYIIGADTQSYTAQRWITSFKINRYETTYNLWYSVKIKAEKNGYTFANPGQEGSRGKRAAAPTPVNEYQPVTMISWYDAIVWCNALSEQQGKTPCYTYKGNVLKDSTDTSSCDLAECNFESDGYRLPTESEWEYAARKTISGFQSGGTASGQVDANGYDDTTIPEDEVSWTASNCDMTRAVGTAGTPFTPKAPPAPGSGNPNGAGLFDMSGNILEFCWDWNGNYTESEPGTRSVGPESGSQRVSRGGSWSPFTPFFYCGDRYAYDANECYNYMGFRIVTTK